LHPPRTAKTAAYLIKFACEKFHKLQFSAPQFSHHGQHFPSLDQSLAPENRRMWWCCCWWRGPCVRVLRDAKGASRWLSAITADSIFAQHSRRPTRDRLSLLPFLRRCFRAFERSLGQYLLELPRAHPARQPEARASPPRDEPVIPRIRRQTDRVGARPQITRLRVFQPRRPRESRDFLPKLPRRRA